MRVSFIFGRAHQIQDFATHASTITTPGLQPGMEFRTKRSQSIGPWGLPKLGESHQHRENINQTTSGIHDWTPRYSSRNTHKICTGIFPENDATYSVFYNKNERFNMFDMIGDVKWSCLPAETGMENSSMFSQPKDMPWLLLTNGENYCQSWFMI